MSLRVSTSTVNTNIPGAYPSVNVLSQPVGLGASGNVVIFGEADGGNSYQNVVLANNSFTPDQLQKVQAQYLSGQIVDAFQALSAPSNDKGITGTANRIYIVKTNNSTKASALVDTDYGTFADQNWGVNGNKYKYQIVSTAAEVAPQLTGTTIAAFGAPLNGLTFTIRLDGGAATVVTLSGTSSDHNSIGTLVVELNAQLPSGIVASAGLANNLVLTMAVDNAAYRKGWGKDFELFDSTPGDLAALGLSQSMTVSSQEPAVEVDIVRPDINLSEALDASADVALSVGYLGTSGTLTINKATQMLTTTVVGGSGTNLSINMAQYRTCADLASFIASQTGYSATATAAAQQLAPSALDGVTAIGVASSVAGFQPARIKKAAYDFQLALSTSRAFAFSATAVAGLPNPMALPAFLMGGARGATLAADIVNVMNQLAGINVNFVVPLFSQDASEDIALGLTDSASTYTIAAVNAATKNHCIQYSTTKLKRNRICLLSFWDNTTQTYINAKHAAQSLGNYRCSLAFQRSTDVNSQGVITSFMPWYTACIATGMQAGGFYKSITNKLANVTSFSDPTGFDSGSPGDVEDALSAGLLILTNTAAGASWVSDQTTYGFDANFVYNSIQAVYDSDIVALDLAASFQAEFVGQSLADVDAATAESFLAQKMDAYKKSKLIAASDDAPLGWKNPSVNINGPEMDISVEIKLATAIYFIPININISQVQQSA